MCPSEKESCGRENCPRNHTGSAKSMEPAGVVALVTENDNLSKTGVEIDALVCDGDSSVAAAVRTASKGRIKKVADVRHNLKHIPNVLFPRRNKQITPKAILNYEKIPFQVLIL
jgi:hypothetical protein